MMAGFESRESSKTLRMGPPKERVDSLLSTMLVIKAGVTGGVADAKALWPQVVPS